MKRIIKHGTNVIKQITCLHCGCEFEYSQDDIETEGFLQTMGNLSDGTIRTNTYVTCPECGEKLYLSYNIASTPPTPQGPKTVPLPYIEPNRTPSIEPNIVPYPYYPPYWYQVGDWPYWWNQPTCVSDNTTTNSATATPEGATITLYSATGDKTK